MNLGKVVPIILLLVSVSLVSAQSAKVDSVDLVVSDTDVKVGDTLDARVDVSGENISETRNFFAIGDKEIVTTSDDELSYTIESGDLAENRSDFRVRVLDQNGDTVGSDREELQIRAPEGRYDLSLEPQVAKPGDTVRAEVTYEGERLGSLNYEWDVDGIQADGEELGNGPSVEFETHGNIREESSRIDVSIRSEEGDLKGGAEGQIRWEEYNPEVEDLDVNYGDGEVEITVSEDRLMEHPEVRFGDSIDKWTKVKLSRDGISGGADIKIEELDASELDMDDREVHSAVKVTGENVDGLGLSPEALVSHKWLEERDLLLSDRQAYVSYFISSGDGWEREPTHHLSSELDDRNGESEDRHIRLEPEHWNAEKGISVNGDSLKIAVAGSEDMGFGRYGMGPQGQCEQFDEGEPIPPGWKELEVTCQLHDEAQRTQEELDEIKTEWKEEERSEEADEKIEEIESLIDDYRLAEAEEKMRNFREFSQERRAREERSHRISRQMQQEGDPENATKRRLKELNLQERLPEGLSRVYNRSEKEERLFDETESLIEEGNYVDARLKMSEIKDERRRTTEARNNERLAMDLAETWGEIQQTREELKENDLLDNESKQALEEAERLLIEEKNIRAAEEKMREAGKDLEIERAREFVKKMLQDPEIRNMVKEIIRDVMPF